MDDEIPVVAIASCRREFEARDFDGTPTKYVRAVAIGAGAAPFLLPPSTVLAQSLALLSRLDGVFLTGSPSNVEPASFGGMSSASGTLHDPARDETVLPLIPIILDRGIPLLAICRGIQELNVALGGSLHQNLHQVPGYLDHREDYQAPWQDRYGDAHMVEVVSGGLLEKICGPASGSVNSLHAQGIDRLSPRLRIEALAPDGVIEAVSVRDQQSFALGVQWHPETSVDSDPWSRAIFQAFGDACREYAGRRMVA